MNLISPNFSDLYKPNVELKKFPDGDNYVCLPEAKDEVNLFHRLYPEQDSALLQALLLLATLKRKNVAATLVSPYLPYARQDKTFKPGEAMSAEVICDLLHYAGAKQLITVDCHFLKKEGKFTYGNLPITNLSANKLLVAHAKKLVGDVEVISPDAGASYLVEGHGGKSMNKVRGEYIEGQIAYRKIEKVEMNFEVKGKNILILDDMISTGGTMLRAVENVKKGGAKKVLCAATHGFFLKDSLAKLQATADHVFVTDSIPCSVAAVALKPLFTRFSSS